VTQEIELYTAKINLTGNSFQANNVLLQMSGGKNEKRMKCLKRLDLWLGKSTGWVLHKMEF